MVRGRARERGLRKETREVQRWMTYETEVWSVWLVF
jgi:hypothetical protein